MAAVNLTQTQTQTITIAIILLVSVSISIDTILFTLILELTNRIQTILFLAQSYKQSNFLADVELIHHFHSAVD